MNLSINGQSQVPPGFRFHPTEEEILHYYLRKKVACENIDLDVIREVDLNKLEPWDIQERCRIGSTPQNDWYFFSHKDKKYPTGTRTNRATTAGFWKATGRDKIIYSGSWRIGLRKTLVFYKGRAPNGQKSDWIMHEYRLDENKLETNILSSAVDMNMPEGWVVCRVFKKKNYQQALNSPRSVSVSPSTDSKIQMLCSTGRQACVLDQIRSYMGRASCKIENEPSSNLKCPENNNIDIVSANNNNGHNNNKLSKFPSDGVTHKDRFMHLPRLESPTIPLPLFDQYHLSFEELMLAEAEPAGSSDAATPDFSDTIISLSDWATLDRLVASQLNGHGEITEPPTKLSCFENNHIDLHQDARPCRVNNNSLNHQGLPVSGCESDFIWGGFTGKDSSSSTSSDPLRHLSV